MAVTQDRPAPYAPASAILSIIDKYRNRGLPAPIDAAVLERAGIPPSLIPRTLQALHTLDLLSDNGAPSDVLEGLRLAPEAEFRKRLADWLAEAYHDALQFVDPATATETDIRDAFRKYTPTGQQGRMVSLFTGLFTAAGVIPVRQRDAAPRPKAANALPRALRAAPKPSGGVRMHFGGRGVVRGGGGGGGQAPMPSLPPALAGLLQSLPANGAGWTQDTRNKFVATLGAVLDFCFPIRAEEPRAELTDEEKEMIG